VLSAIVASVDALIHRFTELPCWPEDSILTFDYNVRALLAILSICFVCGAMGALVVGNRMAFFSDALAHCAFAGVAVGLIISIFLMNNMAVLRERLTVVMVCFGIGVGLLIAYVRERTGLASDTVIGVFYAGAIGLGAVFTRMAAGRGVFNIEEFIFGNPILASTGEVLVLFLLAAGVAIFLGSMYNSLVLAGANSSLALSRRVPVRLCHYLLIVVLALMVNLSLQIVGALLINGLLIVPAATAANFARNLRQMFWYSIGLAVLSGVGGYVLSWEISCRFPNKVGTSGTIIMLAVSLFVVSMLLGRRWRERPRGPEMAGPPRS
jgi:zinc transport system permease protein